MKEKYKLLLFVIIILLGFISCRKDEVKEGASKEKKVYEKEYDYDENKRRINPAVPGEYLPIIKLIKDFDKENSMSNDIDFVEKINMGIPGGDNWLVGWTLIDKDSSSFMKVYIIDGEEVIKLYDVNLFVSNPDKYISFNIMKDIPGKKLGKSFGAIWDYNEDGYEEILSFKFANGREDTFSISGYDKEDDEIEEYCEIGFEMPGDREKGPAPVKFLTYEGQYGFQIYITNPLHETPFWSFNYWDDESSWFVSLRGYTPPEE